MKKRPLGEPQGSSMRLFSVSGCNVGIIRMEMQRQSSSAPDRATDTPFHDGTTLLGTKIILQRFSEDEDSDRHGWVRADKIFYFNVAVWSSMNVAESAISVHDSAFEVHV